MRRPNVLGRLSFDGKKERKENSGEVTLRRAHLEPLVHGKFGVTDAFLANEEESKVHCAAEEVRVHSANRRSAHVFEDGNAIKSSQFTRCPKHPVS